MPQTDHQDHVVTLVAVQETSLSPDVVQSAAQSVDAARCSWLAPGEAVDLFCAAHDAANAQERLKNMLGDFPADIFVQPVSTRRKKLLLADMESTVIEQEMIDELADSAGLRDRVAGITRRAMNGELDFTQALRERVALIKAQPVSILEQVAKRVTFMPGASTLIATMKANGGQCWLASGGFACFARPIAGQLGFDAVFANELIVREGLIAGEVAEPIFDRNGKKELLKKAQAQLGLSIADVVAVGDGANDVPMLAACHEGGGLGVAYRAKPRVRGLIAAQINHSDLTALLYAQGYEKTAFRNS